MAAKKKTGPSTLRGSPAARRVVAAVLEALSGEVGTTEAAERLGVSLSRYYQLEARALQGMLQAVEPRPRGPQKTPAKEIQALRAEKKALERELRRQQTLLRAAQRSVGLPARKTKSASSGSRGRAKRGSRGKTVLRTLRDTGVVETGATHGKAKRDGDPGGADRGERGSA
jgi:hypothetical protein